MATTRVWLGFVISGIRIFASHCHAEGISIHGAHDMVETEREREIKIKERKETEYL